MSRKHISKPTKNARQVLIPGTRKAWPSNLRPQIAMALGHLDPTPALIAKVGRVRSPRRIVRRAARLEWMHKNDIVPTSTYRNPARVARLRKNGRLRSDLR